MPLRVRFALTLLSLQVLAMAALAVEYDPSREPVPAIAAAIVGLAVVSLATRRLWFFPVLVELLAIAGGAWNVVDGLDHGSMRSMRVQMGGVMALVALVALVLLVQRSVRDWYRARGAAVRTQES